MKNTKLFVTFLREAPSEEQRQILLAAQSDAESFAVASNVVYNQVQRDKQAKRGRYVDVGKELGISATRRNWWVANKVLEMANSI